MADRDYAFQWSYGKKELLTLLIPNAYGGPSIGTLDNDSQVIHEYRRMTGKPIDELQAWVYWGDKPSTSGPVLFWSRHLLPVHIRDVCRKKLLQMVAVCRSHVYHIIGSWT